MKGVELQNFRYTPEYIKANADIIDWKVVSINVDILSMSDKFIEDFIDDWDWDYISSSVTLPEDFIRKYHNKVTWDYILLYQKVSNEFLIEFRDKFSLVDHNSALGLKLDLLIRSELLFTKLGHIHYVLNNILDKHLHKDDVKDIQLTLGEENSFSCSFQFKDEYRIWRKFNISKT